MSQASEAQAVIRFAAVGDLLLTRESDGSSPRDFVETLAPIRNILAGSDVVLGNLECTLPGDGAMVPTEPRVISAPDAVHAVLSAGFNIVSLANNHTFDCMEGGFRNLRRLLDEMGVAYFGAGDDVARAASPAVLNVRGIRVAFLGAADPQSGPFQQAGPDRAGVALLELPRMIEQIRSLARQADHVAVSLHWGRERFLIPSPAQIEQAREMVDAGASIVLGHHPHVIQGMELHRNRPIAYSLGNFVACEVPFSDGDRVTWNRRGRTGCALLADLAKGHVGNVRQLATFDDGSHVRVDDGPYGRKVIARTNRALAIGVSPHRFRRHALWIEKIRPVLGYMRWSKLKTLRLRKLRKAFASASKARDSY